MKIWTYVYLLFFYIGNLFSQTIIPGGNVSGTWTTAGSPYHVTGNITVPSGQTLTIDPGVMVKFDSALGMTINGILLANGAETDSILFTRYGSTALWRSIQFTNQSVVDSASQMNYCIVEYGGSNWYVVTMTQPQCKLHINNSLIHHNNWGIDLKGSDGIMTNSMYRENNSAVSLWFGALIERCSVMSNTSGGAVIYSDAIIRSSVISQNGNNGVTCGSTMAGTLDSVEISLNTGQGVNAGPGCSVSEPSGQIGGGGKKEGEMARRPAAFFISCSRRIKVGETY